jgi:periplasmic divalent cation tolerance protein
LQTSDAKNPDGAIPVKSVFMEKVVVILCACPSEATAKLLATGLLEQRLAACVNILPKIRSMYRWQGNIHDDAESLMVIKTTQAGVAGLEVWLARAHPYDVPEIIALPVTSGSANYLDWVRDNVGS